MTKELVTAVYEIHSLMHTEDESEAEAFAIRMGICEADPDESVVANTFIEFVREAMKIHV